MKSLKFKSLTMRIWITFTSIILLIIFSISILYMAAYTKINEDAKAHDLKVAHDTLLQSNSLDEPNNFDELKNLIGSQNFLYTINDDKTTNITKIRGTQPGAPNDQHMNENVPPPMVDKSNTDFQKWVVSFINKSSIKDLQLKKFYKGRKFIIIISSMKGTGSNKIYLVSYIPANRDNDVLYLIIAIGAIFIGIGFFTAKIVANYISKPLKELEAYTIRISHKDWNDSIEVKSNDEIGRLAASMNKMQRELKNADDEEKLFLQSISHDLKTPVMVIMSHADAIMDGVYIDSVEKTAEIIKNEAIRLNKKIKQLLYLNTLDYVLENNEENITLNLKLLLLNIINRFEMVNSTIEWNLEMDDVSINADYDKIQVAVENILDNGLRYCDKKMAISLKTKNNFAVVEIYNDGPNIDKSHLDKIFDNLYKDKTGNFGLGLAISKKIIDFYKGNITVINRPKGVSFIIRFPL